MEWSKLLSEKRVGELFGKEPSEVDSRTAFERDYGRAVFSTPVRRLQDKTQVFPLEIHDSVRTRLTHSLEVSSVARTLGREAGNWIEAEKHAIKPVQVHDIETIAATCGLIHDLGNPPFGHAGETAIQTWFKRRLKEEEVARAQGQAHDADPIFSGLETRENEILRVQYENDFLKWEGNAQTLRLISRLQVLADFYGINLTCATFSAACKYTAASNDTDTSKKIHEKSKPGFFASEQETFARVADETGTVKARNPITFLVESSDDIVYATGDLEDGVRKGALEWEFLKLELQAHAPNDAGMTWAIQEAQNKVGYKPGDKPVPNGELAQAFRTFSIQKMKEAAFKIFCLRYESIMSGEYHEELVSDPDCEAEKFVDACKKVGQTYVYPSSGTIKLELMGRKVIHDLMDVFWEGARLCGTKSAPKECKNGFAGKAFALISNNYRKVFEKALEDGKLPERYCRLQLVTDQIAGMTDTFATTLHKRLMNG
jgi:dGTPase